MVQFQVRIPMNWSTWQKSEGYDRWEAINKNTFRRREHDYIYLFKEELTYRGFEEVGRNNLEENKPDKKS